MNDFYLIQFSGIDKRTGKIIIGVRVEEGTEEKCIEHFLKGYRHQLYNLQIVKMNKFDKKTDAGDYGCEIIDFCSAHNIPFWNELLGGQISEEYIKKRGY